MPLGNWWRNLTSLDCPGVLTLGPEPQLPMNCLPGEGCTLGRKERKFSSLKCQSPPPLAAKSWPTGTWTVTCREKVEDITRTSLCCESGGAIDGCSCLDASIATLATNCTINAGGKAVEVLSLGGLTNRVWIAFMDSSFHSTCSGVMASSLFCVILSDFTDSFCASPDIMQFLWCFHWPLLFSRA